MTKATVTEADRRAAVEAITQVISDEMLVGGSTVSGRIAQAIATARREGAERMRERAAKVAECGEQPHCRHCQWCADANSIRALPLEET